MEKKRGISEWKKNENTKTYNNTENGTFEMRTAFLKIVGYSVGTRDWERERELECVCLYIRVDLMYYLNCKWRGPFDFLSSSFLGSLHPFDVIWLDIACINNKGDIAFIFNVTRAKSEIYI